MDCKDIEGSARMMFNIYMYGVIYAQYSVLWLQ